MVMILYEYWNGFMFAYILMISDSDRTRCSAVRKYNQGFIKAKVHRSEIIGLLVPFKACIFTKSYHDAT
jgi:hypothetical protein